VQPVLIIKLLLRLTLANGAPVIAKRILRDRLAMPLDGGSIFIDGRPLLGRSKTVRGVLLAMLAPAAAAPILGIDWRIGLVVGAGAMAGDLISSFFKRRLGRSPSSRALGLDQMPESLIPLLATADALRLGVDDVLAVVAIFLIGEIVLSRWLYKLRLRDQPY
jgi:CDP-diglyceride synthetase